jgi:hypothetical protein
MYTSDGRDMVKTLNYYSCVYSRNILTVSFTLESNV